MHVPVRAMLSSPRTPALFGRVSAVLAQHADLGAMLREMRDQFAALGAGPVAAEVDPVRLLEEFRTQLVAHFVAEENEEYFGTIGADRPPLTGEVRKLLSEHEHLLRAIDRLRIAASEPERRRELATLLAAFTHQFQTHEKAETSLLREYFALGD